MPSSIPENDSSVFYEPRFYQFHDLIKKRVERILIVSSLYDRFLLEEDGRLGDQILDEYLNLHLSLPPRIFLRTSGKTALALLEQEQVDLVITTKRVGEDNGDFDPFSFGSRVKEISPTTPVVLLILDRTQLQNIPPKKEQRGVDRVFLWTGDSKLFLAIVKLFEDIANVREDVETGKVQVILLVENSAQYYSMFLPMLYSEIMKQTHRLIAGDTVNEFHRLLRMKARPKILLAESFEEGMKHFEDYKSHILGVLSDVEYPMSEWGEVEGDSGLRFISDVKRFRPDMPTLLMSSRKENKQKGYDIGSDFIYKHSPKALHYLRNFILVNLGFGDFVFRLPSGEEVGRAKNLDDFRTKLKTIPDNSFAYHASNNHFSNWLMARGEFELAYDIRPIKVEDFADLSAIRDFMTQRIERLKVETQRGTIADFNRDDFGRYVHFARVGQGSLGGKGRGLAFLQHLIGRTRLNEKYDVEVTTPPTLVLCVGIFDEFVERNNFIDLVLQPNSSDTAIVDAFAQAELPEKATDALQDFLRIIQDPLAVRFSSLLEDAHSHSFGGIYKTYLIPNKGSFQERFEQLCTAVKLVYASTFFQLPRRYVENFGTKMEQEKMAVMVQPAIGQTHGNRYYPDIAGIARSYNYYPFGDMRPEDGVAEVVLGFGHSLSSDGSIRPLRFCPKYPQTIPQFGSPDMVLKHSQSSFLALDLSSNPNIQTEGSPLRKHYLSDAETDGVLHLLGSVYNPDSDSIRDGLSWSGPRVVTFAGVLKHKRFPLSDVITEILELGRKGFGSPVEIEFAITFTGSSTKPTFNLLQIRPYDQESDNVTLPEVTAESTLVSTSVALGHGIETTIQDLVFVKPEMFDRLKTVEIAKEIAHLNQKLKSVGKSFVLIGFGRWGTRDHSLGIPVRWEDISGAKVLVESGLPDYDIDPSFGSHFHLKIVNSNVKYLTVGLSRKNDLINWEVMRTLEVEEERKFVCHSHLSEPLKVVVDGRERKGLIYLP